MFIIAIMAIDVGKDYGAWKKIGGNFKPFSNQGQFIKESRDRYNFSFGDAELLQIAAPDLYIVYSDVSFKQQKIYFRPSNETPDMVKLRFTLSGNATLYNEVNKQRYIFNSNQQNIIYMPELDGIGEYDTNSNYRFFEVHFAKEKFLQLAEKSNRPLQILADDLDAGRYSQMAEQNLPISWAMQNCIHDIINCTYTEGLKLLLIESKCTELLVLQAGAFDSAVAKNENLLPLSAYDKDCIYYARDYLVQHMYEPPSIAQLAKVCGINEFKLKKGFKGLFNKSIFGYLSDYRLNHAKQLLLEGTPIKSVAFQSGYSSVQHFSNAFKKKFAVTPGKLNAQ